MGKTNAYIFKLNSLLRPDDAERVRQTLKKQIEDGLVLHDPRTEFIKHEIIVDGERVEVELIPYNNAGAGGE